MPYPITDSNWSVQVDNKPTFFGVLWKYFDEIAKENRWGPNTQVLYAGQYEKRILPRLSSLPLECYTAEDFKRVIAEISCEEEINAPSTVEHYRKLIKCVIEEAVQEEGIKDPLWGILFSSVTTPKQVQEQKKRSFPNLFLSRSTVHWQWESIKKLLLPEKGWDCYSATKQVCDRKSPQAPLLETSRSHSREEIFHVLPSTPPQSDRDISAGIRPKCPMDTGCAF